MRPAHPRILTLALIVGVLAPVVAAAQDSQASPQTFITMPNYSKPSLLNTATLGVLGGNATTRAQAIERQKLEGNVSGTKHWYNRTWLLNKVTTTTKPGVKIYQSQADYDADHGFTESVISNGQQ